MTIVFWYMRERRNIQHDHDEIIKANKRTTGNGDAKTIQYYDNK